MTPASAMTGSRPTATPVAESKPPAPPASRWISAGAVFRLLLTAAVLVIYSLYRAPAVEWLERTFLMWTGTAVRQTNMAVCLVATVIAAMVALWWKFLQKDKRFHAPMLVTCVLLLGDAGYGILEEHASPALTSLTHGVVTSYSPTFVTILATVVVELFFGRFFWGKWPHLASAYVSGISAGILIKSPVLWPFLFCGIISITSKYVLRLGGRHLWNPTNFGVTMMLFLAPTYVAPLSVQAGNEVWGVLVIWILGGMVLYQIGKLHIPVAFVLAFVPLSIFRAWYTGNAVWTELAPMTSPMFQLYIFFMITDPKTTTKAKWSQILVVALVAVVETILRLVMRDVYSLFHALFIVGPIANVIEIAYFAWLAPKNVSGPAAPAVATSPAQ